MLVKFTDPKYILGMDQDEMHMLVEDILQDEPEKLHASTIMLIRLINRCYKAQNNVDIHPALEEFNGFEED